MTGDTKAFFRAIISDKTRIVSQIKEDISEYNMILRDTKRALFRLQGDENRTRRDEEDALLHITRAKLKNSNLRLKANTNIIKDLQRLLNDN